MGYENIEKDRCGPLGGRNYRYPAAGLEKVLLEYFGDIPASAGSQRRGNHEL